MATEGMDLEYAYVYDSNATTMAETAQLQRLTRSDTEVIITISR